MWCHNRHMQPLETSGSPADAFWGKGFLAIHLQQAQTAKRPEKNEIMATEHRVHPPSETHSYRSIRVN